MWFESWRKGRGFEMSWGKLEDWAGVEKWGGGGESSEQCESAKFPPVSVILPLPKEQCPEIQNNRRSK